MTWFLGNPQTQILDRGCAEQCQLSLLRWKGFSGVRPGLQEPGNSPASELCCGSYNRQQLPYSREHPGGDRITGQESSFISSAWAEMAWWGLPQVLGDPHLSRPFPPPWSYRVILLILLFHLEWKWADKNPTADTYVAILTCSQALTRQWVRSINRQKASSQWNRRGRGWMNERTITHSSEC
jgi:hypothetical protein